MQKKGQTHISLSFYSIFVHIPNNQRKYVSTTENKSLYEVMLINNNKIKSKMKCSEMNYFLYGNYPKIKQKINKADDRVKKSSFKLGDI